jgi:hypothetical protein
MPFIFSEDGEIIIDNNKFFEFQFEISEEVDDSHG